MNDEKFHGNRSARFSEIPKTDTHTHTHRRGNFIYIYRRTEEWRVAGTVGERMRSVSTSPLLLTGRRLAERAHLVSVVSRLVTQQASQVPRLAMCRVTTLGILTDAVPVRIGALVTAPEQHRHGVTSTS